MMKSNMIVIAAIGLWATTALADEAAFTRGPLISDYGPVAAIDGATPISPDAVFAHSFDVRDQAPAGSENKTLVSAARFLNMHVRAGVDPGNISLAVVVHGKAVRDVTSAPFYGAAVGGENANLPLISALQRHRVRIIVCGQSAAYYGVSKDDLAPGVEMALSAMTAHAQLQQAGYSLNPF